MATVTATTLRPPRISIVVPTRDCTQQLAFPAGADEVILQEAGPRAQAANVGARRATGDILVFQDDDLILAGNLNWLRWRPLKEVWWPCGKYVDHTGDPFSVQMAGMMNFGIGMGLAHTIGPVVAVHRSRARQHIDSGSSGCSFRQDVVDYLASWSLVEKSSIFFFWIKLITLLEQDLH